MIFEVLCFSICKTLKKILHYLYVSFQFSVLMNNMWKNRTK
ncbi:hypothetical protein HMPREF0653_01898 [Prevotella disiens JCM 6334 = ATCC 29426]|uniref:Uncharacterized protein n=1 Tax=Prevotella disiens JCM 6334 = ATCC 29426 TaxID=1235811 RepID=A0ABN0NQQ4_9BACT|nr:hypothetical protein HMPREF0653_01898 [Prevotella disiens JCM 6334 = ATCC 29426]